MFDNTISIDFDGAPVVLNRVNQDAYASEYFARVGLQDFRMEIKHTFAKGRSTQPESHLVRLDLDHYDTEGVHIRTTSAWAVIRTAKAVQDDATSADLLGSLTGFLTDAANVTKVLSRQS